MNTDALFQVLSSLHPISEVFRRAIENELIPLSLPKNHLLLDPPKIVDHAFFMLNGFAVSYTFVNGVRQVENFWTKQQFILSPHSLFERMPTTEFIRLTESSDVLAINHSGIIRLFDTFPEANILYRIIIHQHYEHCRQRVNDMQSLKAHERFKKLLRKFPDIEQQIPQDYIASYLGIAPQSLSRIKKMDNG